jgi:hypothetical protein
MELGQVENRIEGMGSVRVLLRKHDSFARANNMTQLLYYALHIRQQNSFTRVLSEPNSI